MMVCLSPIIYNIVRIGPSSFSAVCSDSTGNTKKGQWLTAIKWPRILDLMDACHLLANTCKDISVLPEFKEVSHRLAHGQLTYAESNLQTILEIRAILAFLSRSGYTWEHLDFQHTQLGISEGIVHIGETRFGTVYWTATSVQHCLPAFMAVVKDKALDIDITVSSIVDWWRSDHKRYFSHRALCKCTQKLSTSDCDCWYRLWYWIQSSAFKPLSFVKKFSPEMDWIVANSHI